MKSLSIQILKIVFASTILSAIVSCKKEWFDIKPEKNKTVPATLSDFELLLDNTDLNGSSPVLNIISSDEIFVSETDWQRSLSNSDRNAYTWSNELPYLTVVDWNSAYNRILYSNLVLEGLSKVTPLDSKEQQQWNRLKGDALFHRAKNHFEVASLYSEPYNSSTVSSDLGIPLKLNSDITIPNKRVSVKETYDHILEDLMTAKDLVPIKPLYKTRSSKAAVFSLLSRIFLSIGNYSEALQYADSCLAYFSSLLDYNSRSTTLTNSFPVFPIENKEVIFHSRMHSNTQIGRADLYGKVPLNIYNDFDSLDLRKALFFRKLTDGSIRFKGNYTGNQLLFSGLATDEIYLIKAECLARQNEVVEALNTLNTLLRTRWKANSYVDKTAPTADSALVIILKERTKELLWRGLRWSDLRRFNEEPNRSIVLSRTIGGKTYNLLPKSSKYSFPIPDDVLSMSNMQQNPGW